MAYRLCHSLDTLRSQVDTAFPNRNKASDGWIGDPSHSSRDSDHNPDPFGIVRAIDLTHDPAHGADMNVLTRALVEARDPRLKYIIWDGRILSSTISPWTWRTYTGTNPHDHHAHISAVPDARADSAALWDIEGKDWFSMASEADLRRIIREELDKELDKQRRLLAVGEDRAYDPKKVNLKAALDKK